jgi:hypothetical protein
VRRRRKTDDVHTEIGIEHPRYTLSSQGKKHPRGMINLVPKIFRRSSIQGFEFRAFKALDRRRDQLHHRLEIFRPAAGNQAFEIPCKNSLAA